MKPQKGEIIVSSQKEVVNIYSRKYRNEYLNYMFQNYALLENETVEDNLKVPLMDTKVGADEKQLKISKALSDVNLGSVNKYKVASLSGGEQQRVALARILLKSGNLILADEPTGNLDRDNALIIIDALQRLQENGKIIIVVTHDPTFVDYATRLIEL